MRLEISTGIVILGCFALQAADITPLNVKLGEWETTTTTQMGGMPATPAIPQETLDKMPPEVRARLEERMKARPGSGTPTVNRHCMTKEDLAKASAFGADESCTRTVLSSSASGQDIRVECNRNGMKSTGTVHVEATGPDSVKGSMQISILGRGDRPMTINTNFTSKWLGPTCSEKTAK